MASNAKKHTEVEKLEIAGLTCNFSPTALIVYAKHFLGAAKTAESLQFNPAQTFLACRSIELALKALLAVRGVSLLRLSTGAFGHNLNQLLAEADKNNMSEFVTLEPIQRAEIKRAWDYYDEKVLEYPALMEAVHAYPKMPDTQVLIEASDLLIPSLYGPCIERG